MVYFEDDNSVLSRFPVPEDMVSCHIVDWGRYYVEGHVPLAAIEKLFTEKPDIDGLVLPGMPDGSPGMEGTQQGDFVVYAMKDGQATEFMRIPSQS